MPPVPALPARKAAGRRTAAANTRQLPILEAQTITLEDGSEVRLDRACCLRLCVGPRLCAAHLRGQGGSRQPALEHRLRWYISPQLQGCTLARPPARRPGSTSRHPMWADCFADTHPSSATPCTHTRTQVPIQIPPGMPTAQAQALVAYLKSNPQAAKQAYEQAQAVLRNPAMAQAFANMTVRRQHCRWCSQGHVLCVCGGGGMGWRQCRKGGWRGNVDRGAHCLHPPRTRPLPPSPFPPPPSPKHLNAHVRCLPLPHSVRSSPPCPPPTPSSPTPRHLPLPPSRRPRTPRFRSGLRCSRTTRSWRPSLRTCATTGAQPSRSTGGCAAGAGFVCLCLEWGGGCQSATTGAQPFRKTHTVGVGFSFWLGGTGQGCMCGGGGVGPGRCT